MSSVLGRRLPPSQVDCKWWMSGYCARGKTCHFRHDDALAGAQNKMMDNSGSKVKGKGKANAKVNLDSDALSSSTTNPSPPSSAEPPCHQTCVICFETPDTYGLLINCDHAFCLECIRAWRGSTSGSNNGPSSSELKKSSRTCPMCRSHSDFIIPSSVFPVLPSTATQEQKNEVKQEIVNRYLSRLKIIPCRYFEHSIKTSAPDFKPKCQFGNSCHYSHAHPITKDPYVFSQEDLDRSRGRPKRLNRTQFLEQMAVMEMLLNDFRIGYASDEEWNSEVIPDDDSLVEAAFYESGFLGGYSDDNFDDYDYGWD